ncbi:MAG TPA: D-glycerate dehydrogenase [Anaerolineales bacterium]|jgi:lactate dehydrogenase-like 2-hydroxyacid dehydrogenase
MALPLVLLAHPLTPEWISSLQGRVRLVVGPADPPGFAAHLKEFLGEAEGILCLLTDKVDGDLLEAAPRLRVVSNMAVGFDNIDVAGCTRRGIPVGNTPGVLTDATADLAMALLLSAGRMLPKAAMDARDGLWRTWSPIGWLGTDLRGATLGIVGLGKIGKAVAERARGFGLKLIYCDPKQQTEPEAAYDIHYCSLDELLRTSDFVSLHCPLSEQTRSLIDETALKKMKGGAVLVNTARGPIVSSDALVRALRENWIGWAALDVTDPEPLPPEHPLYDLPNCLIVPHIGSATHGTRRRMAEMACENLLAGLDGRKLPNLVNPDVIIRRE